MWARRAWMLFVGGLAALWGWGTSTRADTPSSVTAGGVAPQLTLQGQLEKGLKARRPVEFQYLADVVRLVEQGQLPRTLVDSSFMYARRMPSRQLQYFQFALRARASKLGIATPSLDGQIAIR